MTTIDLDERGTTLELREGMAWLLYTDQGPSGPCGQSMRITCPHAILHVWPSEQAMQDWLEVNKAGRTGQRAAIRLGVVGSYSGGVMRIVNHCDEKAATE